MTQHIETKDIRGHVGNLVARVRGAAGVVTGGKFGEAIQKLRRRLNSGTWYNPKLNTVELTFSIISLVLIVALELLIHLDILIEGFQMPTWGWLMLVCPTEGTAL